MNARAMIANRRVIIAVALVLLALCGNLWITHKAKTGLNDVITKIQRGETLDSDTFWFIGPATTAALGEVALQPYSISVWPFDWVESGDFVTHTAFVESKDREIRIRLRFNPLDGYFHIVGYATIRG